MEDGIMKNYYILKDMPDEYRTFIQIYRLKKEMWTETVSRNSYEAPPGKYPEQFLPILLKLDGKANQKISDITARLSPFFVFSDKAVKTLNDCLLNYGEFMDIETNRKGFCGYRVTKVLSKEVLDINSVALKEFENGIFLEGDPCFLFDKIEKFDIFSLKEIPLTVFVSQNFKNLVLESKLEGFKFKEVKVV